jgi:hypothetical protein
MCFYTESGISDLLKETTIYRKIWQCRVIANKIPIMITMYIQVALFPYGIIPYIYIRESVIFSSTSRQAQNSLYVCTYEHEGRQLIITGPQTVFFNIVQIYVLVSRFPNSSSLIRYSIHYCIVDSCLLYCTVLTVLLSRLLPNFLLAP